MGNTLGDPRCFLLRHKLRRMHKELLRLIYDTQIVGGFHAPADVPAKLLVLVSTLNFITSELLVAKNDHFTLTATVGLVSDRITASREWIRQLGINGLRARVVECVPV